MDWYRRYHGTCTDPKLAKAARIADVHRAFVIAAWEAVLEYASAASPRGSLCGFDHFDVAFSTDVTPEEAERILDAMRRLRMIDGDKVCAWDKRQFQSDSSAERTKRWRDKKAAASPNVTVTSQERSSDVTVTDQIQSQIQNTSSLRSDAPAAPSPRPDPVRQAFDLGVRILTEAGTPEPQARRLIGQWRKNDGDAVTLEVLQACSDLSPTEPIPWINRALQARRRDPNHGRDQRLIPGSRLSELPG